jgi:hypothetical protein
LAELGGLEALPKDFPWPTDFPAQVVDDSGGTEGSKEA